MPQSTDTEYGRETSDVLNGFLPWLQLQDASTEYVYVDTGACAFALYLKALGHPNPNVGPHSFEFEAGEVEHHLPAQVAEALSASPRNFGALSARLAESQS